LSTAIFFLRQIWRTCEIFFLKSNGWQIPSCFLGQNIIARKPFQTYFSPRLHQRLFFCFLLVFLIIEIP
jgi:hypothetical protein